MIIKIKKPDYEPELIDISEDELKTLDNILLLVQGINELIYSIEARKILVDEHGKDNFILVIVPDDITDKEYIEHLKQRNVPEMSARQSYNSDLKADVKILKRGESYDKTEE